MAREAVVGQPRITIRPIELRDANAFIAALHRHHKPVQGHRFSISAWAGERLVGVATVGRPVARGADRHTPVSVCNDMILVETVVIPETLEVTRLCTDGTPNACSALYAAVAKVGREMGYTRIQTYILATETGVSLRAAGWAYEGEYGGGSWDTPKRKRRTDQPIEKKQRWAKTMRRD